jgi:multiple sugar transport system substrate-binding protein
MRLTYFNSVQAREAIVEPARRLGLDIEDEAVDQKVLPQVMNPALVQDGRPSVREAEHAIELPLLQIVCESWYKKAEEAYESVLGMEAYEALGDVRTVHNKYLDKALEKFASEKERARDVRDVLKALVSKEGIPQVVSLDTLLSRLPAGWGLRRQPISFLGQISRLHTVERPLTAKQTLRRVLQRLVKAHLVQETRVGDQARYELAHEYMGRRITDWIRADERTRLTRRGVLISGGLALVGVMSGVTLGRLSPPPPPPGLTMAVSWSPQELLSFEKYITPLLEKNLRTTIKLFPVDSLNLMRALESRDATEESRDATDHVPWDVLLVDNDTLGSLVQKELVENLSDDYQPEEALRHDALFSFLRKELRIDRRDYFIPFHPNIKLLYYNENILKEAGYTQPPRTWEAWKQLTHNLATAKQGVFRPAAIQAHPGKAAAVTLFEWVQSWGGDPLDFTDQKTQKALGHLRELAPDLWSESEGLKYDTVINALSTDKVAVVDNWTYGIPVLREAHRRTNIKVTVLPERVPVLGGDVLAIPKKADKKRTLKLIELLVAKKTQRVLAEKLFWAPVRDDVYDDVYKEMPEFQEIREAIKRAKLRPTTPGWALIADVLSNTLRDVLNTSIDLGTLNKSLENYGKQLKEIPLEYDACTVPESTDKSKSVKSIKDIAEKIEIQADDLAKVNGRDKSDPVRPQTILLVPKGRCPGSWD